MAEQGKGKIDFPPNPVLADKLAAALDTQKKREEIPAAQAPAPFDAAAYVETAKREYIQLGKKVLKMGFKPNQIPKDLWGPADVTLDSIKKLAREYDKEPEPLKKEKIAAHMQRLGASLGGRITGEVTRAAQGFKKAQTPKAQVDALVNEINREMDKIPRGEGTDATGENHAAVPAIADGEAEAVPSELVQIYGDKVPRRVLKMYEKLTDPVTKKSVIDSLIADEAKKKQREEQKAAARAPAASPIPEPVEASAVPPPAPEQSAPVSGADVDESTLEAPQYGQGKMQEEMDALRTSDAPKGKYESEEHEKLRELLGKFDALEKEKGSAQTAPAERGRVSFNERTEQLKTRSSELDARAEKLGWVERSFRSLGETYNKMSFIKKLGLGVALGLGAAVFSAVSIPTALFFTGGLAAQRAAGMASVFLKIEKQLQEKAGGMPVSKERAMLGAMAYTAVMGYAVKEAVEYASETEFVHTIQEWLKTHYPFGSAETPVPPRAAHVPPAEKVLVAPAIIEPSAEVPAAAPIAPDVEAPVPVEAPLAHETVVTPEPIQTVDLTPEQDFVSQPSAVEAPVQPEQVPTPSEQISAPLEQGQGYLVDSNNNPVLDSQGEPIRTGSFEPPAESPAPAEMPVPAEPAAPMTTPEVSTVPETSAASAPTVEHTAEFINNLKVTIDPTHGHVFKDTAGAAIAYGKDALGAAQKFAMEHPDTSVWVQAENPVLVDGVARPYVFEVKYGGFIFKTMQILSPDTPANANLIGAINPETFVEQLDK